MSRQYTINEDAFRLLTKDSAYALGFIAADGCLSSSQPVLIVVSTDLEAVLKIRGVLGSNHPVTIQRRRVREAPCHRITIGNRALYDSLLALGLTPRKSRTLTMPDVSDGLFFHFLRGYFDGDGNVSPNGTGLRLGFTCGSQTFIKQLVGRIRHLAGVPEPVIFTYRPPQVAWSTYYYGPTALILADRMYADAGDLYLPRKRERIEAYRERRVAHHRPRWMIESATEKCCGGCHVVKPLSAFGSNRNKPDGLNCYCRECARERGRLTSLRAKTNS